MIAYGYGEECLWSYKTDIQVFKDDIMTAEIYFQIVHRKVHIYTERTRKKVKCSNVVNKLMISKSERYGSPLYYSFNFSYRFSIFQNTEFEIFTITWNSKHTCIC